MICEYCHTSTTDYPAENGNCARCGAKLSEGNDKVWNSGPFFYEGYICYSIHNYDRDSIEIQFWLGRELIERIEVDREVVRKRVPNGCSYLPLFWELFLLAHGETDALEWSEKNKKYPARFIVTRKENEELEQQMSLSTDDLAMWARR